MQVDDRLWNDTEKFFRCHTADGGDSDNQIFTDSLYGQMLSHHHFGGTFTLDKTYLESHLEYEWAKNQDTYGMRCGFVSLFWVLFWTSLGSLLDSFSWV